jgi:16S rRNA (adenine1518-N6/adenine1519-N6)-dimethyltransferase
VATVGRLLDVGRGAFRPVPGVDSTVIRIRPLVPAPSSAEDEARLRTLVRAAFQWRRKQLRKILRDHPDVRAPAEAVDAAAAASGVSLEDRPERVSPEQFVLLAAALPRIRAAP